MSSSIKFVILSEAKDLLFARVTAAEPGAVHQKSTFPQPARKHCKFRIARRSFTGERSEHAVSRVGEGTTQSHALSGIDQRPGILLKLLYLRQFFMLTGRKLALTLAFTVLVALAFGVSCRGFFQPNVLESITVQPPSPDIILTQTLTLSAWGTYQDGTRNQITSGVAWSSDTPTVLSINPTSGVATGEGLGTATVTASAQGLSGTASATVYIVITSLTVSPTTWGFNGAAGGSTDPGFTVTANGDIDVSSSAIFTSSNPTYINCVNGTDPVICTAEAQTPPGPYTIVVSYTGSTITYTIKVTAS